MNSYMAMDISKIQAQVIIQCLAYYEIGETLMPDWSYKILTEVMYARQRCEYQSSDELVRSTRFGYATWDHDISTGYDLPGKLTEGDHDMLREATEILLEAQDLRSAGRLRSDDQDARKVLDRMQTLIDEGVWFI